MSRSGYSEDYGEDYPGQMELYRGNVDRAIAGRRGQGLLREMAAALDAMPVKELVAHELVTEEGAVCALGAVAVARKMKVDEIDESEPDEVAAAFGVARCLAAEIAYVNDDDFGVRVETPEQRWKRVRAWVDSKLRNGQEMAGSAGRNG